jgi:uncharacterized protein (TIGR02444 family)
MDPPRISESMLALENDLWTYAIRVYENAEVARMALTLQADHGVNVPMLIFCAWCGRDLIPLREKDIAAAADTVREWDENVVQPLRRARRAAKAADQRDPAIAAFRRKVQDSETRAEQIALALLFAWRNMANPAPTAAPVTGENILAYLGRCAVPASMAVATTAAFAAGESEIP